MTPQIINFGGSHNMTKCSRTPQYIAIHYTGGTVSSKGHALQVAQMFQDSTRQASADYIVDDFTTVQFNPDPRWHYCWAVGGPLEGTSTSLARTLHGKATNANSVSIEICSCKRDASRYAYASDRDWYFTGAALQRAAELTAYLMELYGIDIDRVIMHHHVTGKLCPAMWCHDEAELAGWDDFKGRVMKVLLDNVTPEQAYRLVQKANAYAAKLPCPPDVAGELQEAVTLGITDGSRPCEPAPAWRAAIMVKRAVKR